MVIDAKNRLAVALEIQNLAWQTNTPNSTTGTTCNNDILADIPSLSNCTIGNYSYGDNLIKNMNCESDGKQNTVKIISYGKEKNLLFPAAEYCYEYVPSGCTKDWCGKGQWFLPSISQFNEFIKSFIIYTYQMKALKKPVEKFNQYYWTSNEQGQHYAYWCYYREKVDNYFVSPDCGYSGSSAPKCNLRNVVPFIEF